MKPFYKSTKLWYALATIAAGLISKYAGMDSQEVMVIISAGIALIVGQGMADWGKNALPSLESMADWGKNALPSLKSTVKDPTQLFTTSEDKKAE